ncbi:MAG: hypothetical protein FWD59_10280 [Micrococcales bacterium]|nr:hypothetical protein [Micrococcales bacterium]
MTTTIPNQQANIPSRARDSTPTDTHDPATTHDKGHAQQPRELPSGYVIPHQATRLGRWLITEIAAIVIACLALWLIIFGLSQLH